MAGLKTEDVEKIVLERKEIKYLIDGRKLYQHFLPLFGITGIILTVADIVSDIILAVTDNPWWCGLTWTFIALPVLAVIPFWCVSIFYRVDEKWKWSFWKIAQTNFETAPQLFLQLYIMALSDRNQVNNSIVFSWGRIQIGIRPV